MAVRNNENQNVVFVSLRQHGVLPPDIFRLGTIDVLEQVVGVGDRGIGGLYSLNDGQLDQFLKTSARVLENRRLGERPDFMGLDLIS